MKESYGRHRKLGVIFPPYHSVTKKIVVMMIMRHTLAYTLLFVGVLFITIISS